MIALEMQGFEPWTDENIVRTDRARIINIAHE
jgi:hypothetical protein